MNAAYISVLDTLHTNRKGTTAFPLEQFITQQSSPRVRTEQTEEERGFLPCAGFLNEFPCMEENCCGSPISKTHTPLYCYPLEMAFPAGLWNVVRSCHPCHRLGKLRHAKATCFCKLHIASLKRSKDLNSGLLSIKAVAWLTNNFPPRGPEVGFELLLQIIQHSRNGHWARPALSPWADLVTNSTDLQLGLRC